MTLINYMPPYYKGVSEMEELLKGQQPTFDRFKRRSHNLIMNRFIMQSDEQGIEVLEHVFGIVPNEKESLASRRLAVLIRSLPARDITIKYFQELINIAKIPVTIAVNSETGKGTATFDMNTIDAGNLEALKYLINVYTPANILWNISVSATTQNNGVLYSGLAIRKHVTTTIS